MNAENSQELLEEKTGTATDAHAAKVSGLFARIVKWYDPLNRLLSLGLDQGWRKCLADAVLPGQAEGKRVLDLAAGTLDVTLAVRKRHPAVQVLAMDFCPPMLVHGQKKLSGEDKDFVLSVGADARALPLPDACMDGLTMAFGIRNIAPRSASFAEMARVLKAQRPGLYPGIWDGKDAYLARHLQFLSEKDIACRRQAFRRSRCLCLPRQEHHRIPLGGCLER